MLTSAVHMPQWETLLNLLAVFIADPFQKKKEKRKKNIVKYSVSNTSETINLCLNHA